VERKSVYDRVKLHGAAIVGAMAPGANLELKARDRDPGRSVAVCGEIGATDEGTLSQLDTYFAVPHGRLKLREQTPGDAQLIAYERADDRGSKESRYRIVAVPDPAELKAALGATLGIRVEVRKQRRLFIYEGVRIHLDEVDGLGSFIEFEGVATAERGTDSFGSLLGDLRRHLGIEDDDLLAVSYSDLVEAATADRR
jgi:adenylate cyclase class 2